MGKSLGGVGIEQKGKRTQGHGQQCGDCRQGGGERGVRGLKSNRKNTMKILKKVWELKKWIFFTYGNGYKFRILNV